MPGFAFTLLQIISNKFFFIKKNSKQLLLNSNKRNKIKSNENSVIIRNGAFIIFRGHLFLINYNKKVYFKIYFKQIMEKKEEFSLKITLWPHNEPLGDSWQTSNSYVQLTYVRIGVCVLFSRTICIRSHGQVQ